MPSDSTLYRALRSIDGKVLDGLWEAMAEVRAGVWRGAAAHLRLRSRGLGRRLVARRGALREQGRDGPTYKGGFGFNPMLCTADATGEVLAVRLRPGNAGTTTVADHLEALGAAVGGLPPEVAAGHRPGDDAALVRRPVTVRTDSAGCSSGFVWGCRARNVGLAVIARSRTPSSAPQSRAVGRR